MVTDSPCDRMRLRAFFSSLSLLAKAFLLVVFAVPLLHVRDAYQSFQTRRNVADVLQNALVVRQQVERSILAGLSQQITGPEESVAGLVIDVEPLHKVVTLRFLSTSIDGGGEDAGMGACCNCEGRRSLIGGARPSAMANYLALPLILVLGKK